MNQFPEDFISNLKDKPYIRGQKAHFGTDQVNILSFGLRNLVPQYFGNCYLKKETKDADGMLKRQWSCGQTSVLDISEANSTDRTLEELNIIKDGAIGWGEDMFNSGAISYYGLGRYYGRRNSSFANKPHGVVINHLEDKPEDLSIGNIPTYHASQGSMKGLKDDIKTIFVNRHLDKRENDTYEKGCSDGTEWGKKISDINHQLQTDEKCRKNRKEGYNSGYVSGYNNGYDDSKQGILRQNKVTQETLDREYAKGVQSGLNDLDQSSQQNTNRKGNRFYRSSHHIPPRPSPPRPRPQRMSEENID